MKKTKDETIPRLSVRQRETMLRHVLYLPHLYTRAVELLKDEYFNQDGDEALYIIWFCAKRIVRRIYMNKLPKPDALWCAIPGEIESLVATGELHLTEEAEDAILSDNGLLARLFDSDKGIDALLGETLLADFLREKEIADKLADLANASASHVSTSLGRELEMLRLRDSTLSSMGKSSGQDVIPNDFEFADIKIEKTGVDFVDMYMNGGDAPGEVYGIAGAFGSGKTSLAVQLAFEKAQVFHEAHADTGEDLRYSHIFLYEGTTDEIRRRLITYAGKIHKDSIQHLGDWSHLSTRGELKPYEEEYFRKLIEDRGVSEIPGEYERLIGVRRVLNRNIRVHDFTGSEDEDGRVYGYGYVEEIASSLRREIEEGKKPGAVFIDYVNIACRQHISARGLSEKDHLRHLAGSFGNMCRQLIAVPFMCTVYLFQQLNYQANSRGFGSTISIGDMAEAKNFGENLVFLFAMGPMHRESNTFQFFCVKTRRAPGISKPLLINFKGHLGVMELDKSHVISPSIGTPVSKDDLQIVAESMNVPQTVQPDSDTFCLADYE